MRTDDSTSALLVGLVPAVARMVENLQSELARLNIPTWPGPILNPAEGVLTVWYGLVARTDGQVIWWPRTRLSSNGKALYTFACSAATAAVRLAEDYAEARARPLSDLWQALSSEAAHTRPAGMPG